MQPKATRSPDFPALFSFSEKSDAFHGFGWGEVKRIKSRILVVASEIDLRSSCQRFLSGRQYSVTAARDYDEALGKLDEAEFDVIFAGVTLSTKSGFDLLKEIKRRNIDAPVIMVAEHPDVETASEAVRLGAFECMFKPVHQLLLIHTADKAFRYKALQEENARHRSNLEALSRSVKDSVITVDKNLLVVGFNGGATNVCGITRDYIGKPFKCWRANCKGKCLAALKKTLATNNSVELRRTECRRHDGRTQVVTISASPFKTLGDQVSGVVMAVKDETRVNALELALRERRQFHNIIGQDPKLQKIYGILEVLAETETTVLITGESGTGKELAAEAIHYAGARSDKPLVKVNCSALSQNLLESELFGHVRGAFTGADRDKIGRFEKANRGTIFLDEIGDVSLNTQMRLLRAVQDKVIERVGDSTPIKVDVRVIAATNQDLPRLVRLGKFREDLYYRLKVMQFQLPALRERKDDIPLLIDHFVRKLSSKLKKKIDGVSEDVQRIFRNHSWPGNIRELENTLEHAFIVCRQNTITISDLPEHFHEQEATTSRFINQNMPESETILQALMKSAWNKSMAARLLGVNVRTIYRKIQKYNLPMKTNLT